LSGNRKGLIERLNHVAFSCRPFAIMLAAMPMRRIVTIALAALCLSAGPVSAQFFPFFQPAPQPQAPRPRPPGQPRPANVPPQMQQPDAASPAAPTPYDPDLQRLSEILGALHYLRGICGSNEGQKWRNEAQTLIDAEAPSGDRRDKMVQSFNLGYRGFQQSYRTCTPAANLVIRRYVQEGAKIARDITARYAN
jgi:uncharacterized protein (TIGR02301 family)